MTVHRMNFTRRKRLRRESIRIHVDGQPPAASFRAEVDLSDYQFDPGARVVIEAYSGWLVQRFEWGEVGSLRSPEDTMLTGFDGLIGLLFRVKVIGVGGQSGRILGGADAIHPSGDSANQSAKSFLVVRSDDLPNRVWRLELNADQAILLINRDLGDHRDFLGRQEVTALVFPEVLHRMLSFAVRFGVEEEGHAGWMNDALELGARMAGRIAPAADNLDEIDGWLEDVLDGFGRKYVSIEQLRTLLSGDE